LLAEILRVLFPSEAAPFLILLVSSALVEGWFMKELQAIFTNTVVKANTISRMTKEYLS